MPLRPMRSGIQISLVERRKTGIELTEQGEEIARCARTILASVRDLVDYAKQQEGVLSGVLKLGAIPSIAPQAPRYINNGAPRNGKCASALSSAFRSLLSREKRGV